ncbi:hypothetical protein D5S18_18975 [Nocardia panacis]|uniref:Uncharacterized protein n=1 Tax=Nocardia panacis TaxID=2340916 RepID=A0A3A4KI23_9NOCA|nr:hypothetical protein [Nocardia panacis]RJO73333.1 hypothetical protein D5S18_18975 [Nocardia panacis]
MTRTPITAGILADGAFKVLLACAYTLGSGSLGDRLGVAPWVMIICGATLLIGGGTELGYIRNRPARTYIRLMIAYDSGWVVATLVALLLARQNNHLAGELWIGYQTVAPLAFAALLVAADSPLDNRSKH